jgi:predicted acetyltransferase
VRTEALWDRIFARERRQLLVCEDGYVAFAFEQEEAHAPTIAVVEELAAATDDARRVLFGALGALRDQVSEVVIEVDANDPIEHALLDADRRRFGTDAVEHALGEIVAGPMVRIEDVHRAIEARGYAADGSFDVVVADEIAMSVRVDGGRAEVGAARGTSALRAGRASLAAIFYGGLRPSDAARLGLVDADERTLARIDAIVAMPAVAPIDAF